MDDFFAPDTKLWRVSFLINSEIPVTLDPVFAEDEDAALEMAVRMAGTNGIVITSWTTHHGDYEVVESKHDWSYLLGDSDRTH